MDTTGRFNYNDAGHMTEVCPEPPNLLRAEQLKLEYLCVKKEKIPARLLLVDICL